MKLTDVELREFQRYLTLYDFQPYIFGKTFLITGSKGIVGSGIMKWLLLANRIHHANVHIIASTRNPEQMPSYLEAGDSVTFCRFGEEQTACQNRPVDFIVHAATATDIIFRSLPLYFSSHICFSDSLSKDRKEE